MSSKIQTISQIEEKRISNSSTSGLELDQSNYRRTDNMKKLIIIITTSPREKENKQHEEKARFEQSRNFSSLELSFLSFFFKKRHLKENFKSKNGNKMHKSRNSANNRFKSNLKIQITSTMEFNPKTKKQIR